MQEALYSYYSKPQIGGGVFAGTKRHMVGGGFFGTLLRSAVPIIKNIGKSFLGAAATGAGNYLSGREEKFLPSVGKAVGNEALNFISSSNRSAKTINRKSSGKLRSIKSTTKRKKKKSASVVLGKNNIFKKI